MIMDKINIYKKKESYIIDNIHKKKIKIKRSHSKLYNLVCKFLVESNVIYPEFNHIEIAKYIEDNNYENDKLKLTIYEMNIICSIFYELNMLSNDIKANDKKYVSKYAVYVSRYSNMYGSKNINVIYSFFDILVDNAPGIIHTGLNKIISP